MVAILHPTINPGDDLVAYLAIEGDHPAETATGPERFAVWHGTDLVAVGLSPEGALTAARLAWADYLSGDLAYAGTMSAGLIRCERDSVVVSTRWPLRLLEAMQPLRVEDGAL